MATIIDSYSESNQSGFTHLYAGATQYIWHGAGQAFTGDGGILNSVKFYLKKVGSPTGNIYAKIYAETHATAFGTDSLPTGSVLATSAPFDASTLTTSFQLITFNFSGLDKATLTNGNHYFSICDFNSGSANNDVVVGYDSTTPTHSGNFVVFSDYDGWVILTGGAVDGIFYVYKDDVSTMTGVQSITGVGTITF